MGLSVATILGYLFDPEKGYWVVLTILVVMRSNAGGTWVAAVQRIIGTAIGFGIATGIIEAAGDTTVVYAVLLPVLAFGVVIVMALGHPILGAALITTMILILFNIMAPTGWEIGLLRVRDTAIGAAIGLAIGLLMWPQGASGLLRKALARGFDASARYLRTTFTAKSAGAPLDTDARDAALVNADRAEQVYQQYLGETGEKPVPPELYLKLLIANERLWYSTLLVDKRAPDTIGVCPPVVTELNGTVGELDAGFTAIARALRASRPEGSPKAEAATAEQLAPLSQSSLDCLQSASGERSRVVYLLLMRYWLLSLVDNLHDAQVCIPANGDGVRILGTDDRGISSTTAH